MRQIETDEKTRYTHSLRNYDGNNLKRAYTISGVLYGNYLEVKKYYETQYTFNQPDTYKSKRQQGEKRIDSIRRSRASVYRLIVSNIVPPRRQSQSLFITYTFAKPVFKSRKAYSKFKTYIERCTRAYDRKIAYLAVLEKHRSGSYHIHAVIFNMPNPIVFSEHDKLWGQGNTAVTVKTPRGEGVARYLSKYITKDFVKDKLLNEKLYYNSQGLNRPEVLYNDDTMDSILKSRNGVEVKMFQSQNYKLFTYKLCTKS